MIPLIGFFVAGLFFDVWPWGLVVAAILQGIALALFRFPTLETWWYRSRPAFFQVLFLQIGMAVVLHGCAMFVGNLVRLAVWQVPLF